MERFRTDPRGATHRQRIGAAFGDSHSTQIVIEITFVPKEIYSLLFWMESHLSLVSQILVRIDCFEDHSKDRA